MSHSTVHHQGLSLKFMQRAAITNITLIFLTAKKFGF